MSTTLVASANQSSSPPSGDQRAPSRWIINSWLDLLLFTATPLMIVPLVFLLQSDWIGVDIETISIIVAGFGGLGHHLPGMIRAYGDRDLFHRFRWRFIAAPIFLLAMCVPMSEFRLNGMYLVLSVWGCWHALMQVYGFVRIYDVKVGSIAPATAMWDWLLCLSWFSAAQVLSNGKMARMLEYFYNAGGPLIPPNWVHGFRAFSLFVCVAILIGFLINHVIQTRRGPSPNPAKLLMLATGIGFWWFAMVYVENIVLGIALFEIFHDIQYLAIVWLYNCRRVNTSREIAPFMRFIFRRGAGLIMLYVGLVLAYGYLGIMTRGFSSDALKRYILGFIWASTLLHFYYDGFIWKVREKSTREGLGLSATKTSQTESGLRWGGIGHALKWTPLVLLLVWLSTAELKGTTLPKDPRDNRSWPYSTQFERTQNIAKAVPDDLRSQRRAAMTLANSGKREEAIRQLKSVLARHPEYAEGYRVLGEIHHVRGELNQAMENYQTSVARARNKLDRADANLHIAEIYLSDRRIPLAREKLEEVLRDDPKSTAAKNLLAKIDAAGQKGAPN